MVDSGSEANIIESILLPVEIVIDKYKTILFKGVNQEFHRTIGTIEIAIFGKTTTFHVVSQDFDIHFFIHKFQKIQKYIYSQ